MLQPDLAWKLVAGEWEEAPHDGVVGADSILQMSDLHLGHEGKGHERAFERICRWAKTADSAIVVTGDLAHHPEDLEAWQTVAEQLDGTGLDWAAIPGNHDLREPAESLEFSDLFGRYPRLFRAGGMDLLLLDSFTPLADSARSYEDRVRGKLGHYAHGAVGSEQLRAATKMWQGGRRVVAVHHHLHEHREELGRPKPTDADREQMRPLYDVEPFLEWCREQAVELVLTGHQHAWTPPEVIGGVPNLRGTRCTRPDGAVREIRLGETIRVQDWRLVLGSHPN